MARKELITPIEKDYAQSLPLAFNLGVLMGDK